MNGFVRSLPLAAAILAGVVAVSVIAHANPPATHATAPTRTAPTSTRVAYLRSVARRGQAITRLLVVGQPASRARALAASTPEVSVSRTADEMIIQLGAHVRWTVTLGAGDTILGYSASGYDDLMTALGVDFAGNAYTSGN